MHRSRCMVHFKTFKPATVFICGALALPAYLATTTDILRKYA